MAIYRALTNLETGKGRIIERGCVFSEGRISPDATATLLRMGKIAVVTTPPLAALPDWAQRAKVLAKADIKTAEQLCEAKPEELAKQIDRPAEKVKAWQAEILEFFVISPKRSR